MKKLFREFLPQVILIVFSVVLGLYLSDAISKRQQRKKAKQLEVHIKKEIQQCRDEMVTWIPYHHRVIRKLDSLKREPAFMKAFQKDASSLFMITPRGLMNADFTTSAWEMAILNPAITEIEYERITEFSKVYEQIEITFKPLEKIMEAVYERDFNSEALAESNLTTVGNLLHELAGREYSLLANCNRALGDTMVTQNILIDSLIRNRPVKI